MDTPKPHQSITAEDFLRPNLEVSPEQSQRAYLNILEDMQVEKQDMENQRKATFNIMEDITEAQEELKKKLLEVQTLRETLESLTVSLVPRKVMDTISTALNKLIPYYSLSYVIWQGEGAEFASLVYIHAKGPMGQLYISSIQRDLLQFVQTLPSTITNRGSLEEQLRKKMYSEFLSGSYDDNRGLIPASSFVVPFKLRSSSRYILGLFHIASINPKDRITEDQIQIINDVANIAAINMERIKSIASTEQARLASLLRSMTNGVILFDNFKSVMLSNPAAGRMLGFPEQSPQQQQQQILFREVEKIFEKDGFNFSTKVREVLEQGKEFFIEEFSLLRFTYEIYLEPVRDVEGGIIGGAIILHDVTHLKAVDKMKTEFVSVASHQLRTPLTAMKLFVEMLANEDVGKLNKEQKDYINNVQQSSERMIRLVNDLLNVSRIETGRLRIDPEATQLEDFISSIMNECDPLAKVKLCNIVFKKPAKKLPTVQIDPSLMRQVIHNLVMNAVRYSPPKQCDIIIKLEQKNSDYIISIKDSGIGIPKETQSRIFDKFFRADNAQKLEAEGSGLGLYVAKMITEASGGKIWFESPPKGEKKGTIFYVSIPAGGMKKKKGERTLAT